ncbi:MAG: squalene/phytoene synthase family protein [Archangium sp.]
MDLDDLLQKTSRTFALAIPLLPEPTRRAVGVAYLLFRVADTFEDATDWPRNKRIEALERFVSLLELPLTQQQADAKALATWSLATPPVDHAGYLELLALLPELMVETAQLAPAMREVVVKHTVRTAEGMAQVVARADERGNLRLSSVQDLKDYCYIVAGIVGELLTDAFLIDAPQLRSHAGTLRDGMLAFGEGLQLVNILKDAGDDARDGRVYLPPSATREEIFALARADLDLANGYVQALQKGGAPSGYLAFTGLSLGLAFKALDTLEAKGTGAKVSRADVGRFFEALQAELAAGSPLDLRSLAQH